MKIITHDQELTNEVSLELINDLIDQLSEPEHFIVLQSPIGEFKAAGPVNSNFLVQLEIKENKFIGQADNISASTLKDMFKKYYKGDTNFSLQLNEIKGNFNLYIAAISAIIISYAIYEVFA